MEKDNKEIMDNQYQNFRMYHQLQYDRMDKNEIRRENFSHIVLTISLASIAFGFSKDQKSQIAVLGITIIIVAANICGMIFSYRSREFIKMHQHRAKLARLEYAPELQAINIKVGKRDSDADHFNRNYLYIFLHLVVLFVAIFVCVCHLCGNNW